MSDKPSEKSPFCILPWIHSFVNSNGNYQVCCTSEEHHIAITEFILEDNLLIHELVFVGEIRWIIKSKEISIREID